MTTKPTKLKCTKCQRDTVGLFMFPDGRIACMTCLRKHLPNHYRNLAKWIRDHPPAKEKGEPQ